MIMFSDNEGRGLAAKDVQSDAVLHCLHMSCNNDSSFLPSPGLANVFEVRSLIRAFFFHLRIEEIQFFALCTLFNCWSLWNMFNENHGNMLNRVTV